jgi:hypothetical protein
MLITQQRSIHIIGASAINEKVDCTVLSLVAVNHAGCPLEPARVISLKFDPSIRKLLVAV